MTRLVLPCVLLLAAGATGRASAQARLEPQAVLDAVERWLPALLKAEQDRQAAEADVIAASGAFDLTLRADTAVERGFYDNETLRVAAEQPLSWQGGTLVGGYRLGRGGYAPYDGKAQTLSQGEFFGGATLPLLRDRAVDARRTERRLAALGVDVATASLSRQRLGAYRDALLRYWDAVAAAEQWRVQAALLQLADTRDRQLEESVRLGQVAAIERTDNARAVRQRRAALVAARRALEFQVIELSLFLRDAAGQPRRVEAEALALPPQPLAADVPDEPQLVADALVRRPEMQALTARRAQLAASQALARNALLPQLNLFSEVARDVGTGPDSRAGAALRGGVTFTLPAQRRRALGQAARLEATLGGLDEEIRFATDRIRADVQDALSAWHAAGESLAAIREELAIARELEGLERDRFALGDSTQFMVNLRELATADAALREVRAVADRHKALAALDAATGRLLAPR
jgi:outer membrane protein TolC